MVLRLVGAARLLEDQVDVRVDERTDQIALGRLIHTHELWAVHHTSQSLLVVLANVGCWRLLLLEVLRRLLALLI